MAADWLTMNEAPLVSVLVTCFNGLPYIRKALDCLLNQTYSNFEIVVIDDHSTDGTDIYLAELAVNDPRVIFFHNKGKGRGKALNFGLEKCRGAYVAINDADDYSVPERIQKQVDFLETHPEYGLVGSMSELVLLETGEVLNRSSHRPVTNDEIRKFFVTGQPIQHVTVLFRTALVRSLGGYNEKINFLFDRDLFLKIAKVSKVHNLEENLVLVGEHTNRYFKYQYKGIERDWMSTKYQIKAILAFGFSPFKILPVLAKFMYSVLLNIKHFFTRYEKN